MYAAPTFWLAEFSALGCLLLLQGFVIDVLLQHLPSTYAPLVPPLHFRDSWRVLSRQYAMVTLRC